MTAPLAMPAGGAFAAAADEGRRFLAAHPDLAWFDLMFTGMAGVPRGKRLRRHEIEAVYAQGRFLPGSLLVVDMTGRDVTETGLVWEDGDADRIARPVPGRIARAPWLGDDVGQIMLSLHELDGRVCALDPRAVLQRVLDRFAADGFVPVVACELEFYLLDARRARDGSIRLPRPPDGRATHQMQVYGLPEIEDEASFLRELWAACDALGVPLEGVIAEASAGQFELTLRHKPDALGAADDAVLYKRAAKGVAQRHGRTATFMAKPWAQSAGSGLHLHVSLNDAAGANLMADPSPTGGSLLHHAIGGMSALLGDSMAVLAPNMNSYRRFRAQSYAPVAPTWGINNRTVALRVPAGPPESRHVEHRMAGADANPYLALAAVLAGVHHGIVGRIDPGPATTGDGYAATARGNDRLPTDWFAAIDRFERSTMLRDYLGDGFVDAYACVKRVEQARFLEQITAVDYDWCLHNA